MPGNKRNKVFSKKQAFVGFIKPTKWKMIALVIFYFSNYISFLGLLFNFPIYYLFYWGEPLQPLEGMIAFTVHLAYLYLLSCLIVRVLR